MKRDNSLCSGYSLLPIPCSLFFSTPASRELQLDAVQPAEQGDGDALGVEEALGHGLHLGGIHRVDARDDFVGGEELGKYISWRARLAMREFELSSPMQDVALQLVLGAGQFFGGERRLPSACGTRPESGRLPSSALPAEVPA